VLLMTDHNLAYLDREFLESEEARSIRILAEYFEPLRRFKAQKIQDTVVFFGSARIKGRSHAEAALARLQQRHQAAEARAKKNGGGRNGKNGGGRRAATATMSRRTAEYATALKRAKQAVVSARFYEDARRLAHLLTTWTATLESPNHRFVVCSGGGPGIMEAANRGALEAGGKSIGLNINLPFEQGLNRYTTEGLGFEFHYFFMRKFWFAYLAKALVIFPGGFGTMDEMFEILTLAQTQKLSKELRVILYGGEDYWDEILKLDPMVEWGMISPEDRHLLHRVNDPEEAFEYLRDHLTRYHLVPETAQEQKTPGIAKTRK
jgi:uncharacterized protein (TIGR00730 family)